MMVALVLYAYCEGERSSRQIERRCREDIAFRVLTANQQPDHATICCFRQQHEGALSGLDWLFPARDSASTTVPR